MFAPTTKLLRLTAIVVVPLAALAGIFPDVAGLCVGAIVLFVLLALFDALRGHGALAGLAVTLPPVARLTRGRPGELAVQLHNRTNRDRQLRLGLALPPELESPEEVRAVHLPIASVAATLLWPLTARQRGRFSLATVHVGTPSPFGLWEIRRAIPAACEVRSYPDLRPEQRSVAALFLNRGNTGTHAQRLVGKGREFEKLREYLPGDPAEDIHWRATAKRQHPVTKVFQLERTQEVYLVLDASRLSARPATRSAAAPTAGANEPVETVLDRCVSAALLLAAVAERQGDLFGVIAFDDRVRRFVRARTGRGHFAVCRDALHHLQSRPVSPDFEDLCATLRVRLRRRALVVFLTALDDSVLAESFVRGADLIARQHLVQVIQPRPPGAEPAFSPRRPVQTGDDLYAALGGHLRWQRLRELEQGLRRHGVRFAVSDHDAMTGLLIRQYLDIKSRQLI